MPNTWKLIKKAQEPQLDEDEKNVAYIRGFTANDLINRVVKDIYMLKKPIGVPLNRKNVIQPFEDVSPIEFICQKNDCSLFLFSSHNKKRPNNLVMGRLFEGGVLDMVEFGVEMYKAIEDLPARISLGVKPILIFAGEPFETDFDMIRIKNLLNDFFLGPRPTSVRVKGIEHVIMFVAHSGKIFIRPYLIEQKKVNNSEKVAASCHEMGPQLDLVVRRTRIANHDHFTQACKQKPKAPRSSRNKNVSKDELGTTHVVPARFTEKFSVVQAKSGESAKLECNGTGDQPLTVNWFKEDSKLSKRGGENFEIYETTTSSGVNSVLVIRAVGRADGLTYKCTGENEYGNDERLIKLMVVEPPSRPLNVRVKDAWSRSASLVWSTPFAGNSPIVSYVIQYWRKNSNEAGQSAQNHRRQEFTVSGTQTSALITNLNPSLTYEASVIAENQVGRGEPSENVVVNTSEDEPTAAPSDVVVEARGPSTIRVVWKAPPSETWNGKLLGFYIGFRPRNAPNTIDVHQNIQMAGSSPGAFSYRTIDYIKGQQVFEAFLANLIRGHEYEVIVKAFNSVGSGPDSHMMTVRTFDGDLPAPPSLFAHQTTPSSISLRWTYPSRAQSSANSIKRYILYYQRQGDDSWMEIGIPIEEKLRSANHQNQDGSMSQSGLSVSDMGTTNYLLSGLDSGFAYKIYVVAVNNFGMGDPSNIVTTKTEQVNGVNDSLRSASHSGELGMFDKQYQLFIIVPIVCTIIVVVGIVLIFALWSRRPQNPPSQHVVTSQPQTLQSTGSWGPEGTIQVGQRYVEFDKGGILKSNGLLLTQGSEHNSSGHQGNGALNGHYQLPYGTMPMNSVVISDQKSWDRQSNAPLKPLVTHIYDSPI